MPNSFSASAMSGKLSAAPAAHCRRTASPEPVFLSFELAGLLDANHPT
jgi:hypothetical protein